MEKAAGNIDKALIGEVLKEIVDDIRNGGMSARTRIGLMSVGSEHIKGNDSGQSELVNGALKAMRQDRSIHVVMLGPRKIEADQSIDWIETEDCEADITAAMNEAIESGKIEGAVALHYPFPLGTATIGRIQTPAKGEQMLVASTTGTTSTERVEAMVKNTVCAIAVAKALGIQQPTVGVLNLDGASSVTRILNKLNDAGYEINFGESMRKDGGSLLRGNDLLTGGVDVCVTDTLTGNVLMKLFSSWNSGGVYETTGLGYGPSVGDGWSKIISIISRASGAPVIANALSYTAEVARGKLPELVRLEFEKAKKAGLLELMASTQPAASAVEATPPPPEPTDEEIHGVDVLSIDDATQTLWSQNIYAEASMGCTGPVVKVPGRLLEKAREVLASAGYL